MKRISLCGVAVFSLINFLMLCPFAASTLANEIWVRSFRWTCQPDCWGLGRYPKQDSLRSGSPQ